jgi:hypothetical protein
MADVVEAVMGDELASRKRELPESLTGMSRDIPMAHEPTRRAKAPRMREDVMREMTMSAPGSTIYTEDPDDGSADTGPIEASPNEDTRAARPSNRPGAPFVTPTTDMTGQKGVSRDRLVTLGAVAIALVAVGAAGFVLFGKSQEEPLRPDLPTPEVSMPPGEAPMEASPRPAAAADAEMMVFDDPEALEELDDDPVVVADDTPEMARSMRRTMRSMSGAAEMTDDAAGMNMSLVEGVPIFDDDDF